MNELEKLLNEHRKKAGLVCPKECFCWEVEAFLLHGEVRETCPRCMETNGVHQTWCSNLSNHGISP